MPSKDSMPKKKPVYGDKRRKKPNAHSPEGACCSSCSSSQKKTLHPVNRCSFCSSETSEVTSPTSETPEPVVMETEVETPAPEPGEFRGGGGGGEEGSRGKYVKCRLSAAVKPDVAVDDWEDMASDEEKGELGSAAMFM